MAGKAALVTGASSGIGMATALHLAKKGFVVWASMRDMGRRQSLDQAAAAAGVSLNVCHLDVTDPESIRSTVADMVNRHGYVHGLVNNAGIQLRGYFEDVSDDEVRQVFETNVFGSMAVTRAVVPGMRSVGSGRIVFISSIGGLVASPTLSAYCGTKFAIERLGETLALELTPFGIHVSVVAPPIVKTDIWSRNRKVSAEAHNPQSPYFHWFRKYEALTDRLVERARVTPCDVARVVGGVIDARSPRFHYQIGTEAKVLLALRRMLPDSLFNRCQIGLQTRLVSRR